MTRVIKIHGQTFGITSDGTNRFRKNWKNPYWKSARIEKNNQGSCEWCRKDRKLTIHHDPPLSETVETRKLWKICKECHTNHNRETDTQNKYRLIPSHIVFCKKCHPRKYNFFVELEESIRIYCKECGYNRILVEVAPDSFEFQPSSLKSRYRQKFPVTPPETPITLLRSEDWDPW